MKIKVVIQKTYIFDIDSDNEDFALDEAIYYAEADGGQTNALPDFCIHYEETYPKARVV